MPVVAVLALTSSPANAEPAVAADVTFVSTVTNQIAWAHQCAAFHCGYHAIPSGTIVRVACYVFNENLEYDLVVAPAPWDGSTIVAGYVDRNALRDSTSQRCVDVGPTGTVNTETWAHSCPSLNCGYGQMYQNENIGPVCRTAGTFEGRYWDLLIDHSPANANSELAGFVPIADWPHADPTTPC
ncbi:hypothetical protein AB0L41_12200 [Amycolatopsis mediterranei]|uniref:hypothetical protein n=1 Tax=Amycolatopsis mediterranei TaxID=33910 RepID=UPI003447D9AD